MERAAAQTSLGVHRARLLRWLLAWDLRPVKFSQASGKSSTILD